MRREAVLVINLIGNTMNVLTLWGEDVLLRVVASYCTC